MKLVEKTYYLHKSAKEAYRSYLLAYASHGLKNIFDVGTLDLPAVAKSFGLTVPPKVTLPVKTSGKEGKRKREDKYSKSGHAFSAENPYGKRAKDDKRQFAH
ncbi:ATP-dependent RNA helicase DDX55,related [Achlya hypogyna]|uniref:ATP-dependent RNA helicase DDX55,related n=1 Tax=Achlya hypogyna TaxID=1202772 RepID=A0A1V9YW62_ACHHY|nr:ATP-dependent RNA helicase DDX55,related [Achlya hypogyna]